MKKTAFVLLLAAVLVMAFAGSAYASAHGGFSATTTKCEACHAVHGGIAGVNLFRFGGTYTPGFSDASAQSCMFCHQDPISANPLTGVVGSGEVYTSMGANPQVFSKSMHKIGYTGAAPNDSGLTFVAGNEFTCVDCHDTMPHGNGWVQDITIAGKTISSSVAASGDVNNDIDNWCGRCHDNNLAVDGSTHRTFDTVDGDATGPQHAYVASANCTSCHAANEYHEYNGSAAFLTPDATIAGILVADGGFANQASYSSISHWGAAPYAGAFDAAVYASPDGYCISCHRDNGTTGVGLSF